MRHSQSHTHIFTHTQNDFFVFNDEILQVKKKCVCYVVVVLQREMKMANKKYI